MDIFGIIISNFVMHMICKKVKFMKPLTFVTISIFTCTFLAMPICHHLSHSSNLKKIENKNLTMSYLV